MPINEQVIDALEHVLCHYQQDHPEAGGVSAGDLADYADTLACGTCLAPLVEAVGVGCGHLACAIAAVWDSEVWQAHDARRREG